METDNPKVEKESRWGPVLSNAAQRAAKEMEKLSEHPSPTAYMEKAGEEFRAALARNEKAATAAKPRTVLRRLMFWKR